MRCSDIDQTRNRITETSGLNLTNLKFFDINMSGFSRIILSFQINKQLPVTFPTSSIKNNSFVFFK